MSESQQLTLDPRAQRLDAGHRAVHREAVVGLETVVFTHGLPPDQAVPCFEDMARAIREEGAEPAACAVLGGKPTVGVSTGDLKRLIAAKPDKVTPATLPGAIALGRWAATTAGAAMLLAHHRGVLTLATGGIGGVHRGGGWDISGDLGCLARLPMVVVCSGAKSLLDMAATMEVLETLGVIVLGYRTSEVPAFYTCSTGLSLEHRVDSPEEVTSVWHAARAAGSPAAVLLLNPPPAEMAYDRHTVEEAVRFALETPSHGPSTTPAHLAAVQERLGPRSVELNRGLLVSNARLAARVGLLIGTRTPTPDRCSLRAHPPEISGSGRSL
ncbi:pseudouridine-5'-phosphate glycosidase [Candidatus Fermentibacteria bacterium]|nr:pseudouridine-5'-phosphate glycosidase [Candidatus Fermentibacteria bacterium]